MGRNRNAVSCVFIRRIGGKKTGRKGKREVSEGKSCGQCESVRNKVDAGNNVQFRFPVQGEIDRGVLKFIVQADDAGGSEVGGMALDMVGVGVVFEAQVGAAAIEPGEGWGTADKLVSFVETTDAKAVVSKGDQSFEGVSLVPEIFYADSVIQRGGGRAEADAHRQFIVLCRQMIVQAGDCQERQAKSDGFHDGVLSLLNGKGRKVLIALC